MVSTVKIGDVAKVISGYAFKSDAFKTGGSVPVLKIKNIKVGTATLADAGYVDEEFVDKLPEKFHVKANDILISLTGSHMTQPNSVVGRVGRYPQNYPRALLNQRAGKIIPNASLVDDDFLFYVLMQSEIRGAIAKLASGAASQANVSPSQVESIEFPLPEMELQKKLGRIFKNYDNLIENNNRRIAILEEMAQSLYHEWFVKFRFPGHENTTFIDSPFGKTPKGWEVKASSEVIDINPRTKLSKETENPFISMRSLSETSMIIEDVIQKKGNSGAKFQNKDTLLARITPCLENGKTGFVQFLTQDQPVGFGSTEFIVLRSKSLTPEFVYCLARSGPFRDNAIKSMAGSDGRQRVKPDCFNSYYLPVPSDELIHKFSCLASPAFNEVFTLSKKNENLKKQRDMLLPKLISGQIKI